MAVDPTVVALVGTIFGGVGLKLAEHWLGRNKVKVDDASRLRDELRLEITAQREEIKALEAEVDKWRKEYYDLFLKYTALETDLKLALHNIKQEAERGTLNVDELSKEPPPTP
jgi:predicted  nucleic acid-binding Zn-ribbon protein